MLDVKGYAALSHNQPLSPFSFHRRDLGPSDILIDILYSGVCHSDIHQARDEWGGSIFPMVPGHEIVGKVVQTGAKVTHFKVGDLAGVGCFVDSCRTCASCREGEDQYCENGITATYNGYEKDGKTPTYGGYSTRIVVDEKYSLRIPKNLDLAKTAPLLCAGITTYSPLRHWKISKGHKVGIVGLGGLGHMAVKFSHSFGAEVTVLSTSPSKEGDARRLGADHFVVTTKDDALNKLDSHFDFLFSTISVPYNLSQYMQLLKRDGTMIVVGVPPEETALSMMPLIVKRRRLVGSLIGGIRETQEMLDYCGENNITSDVEVISIQDVNKAYERMIKSDVKYRFVIDIKASLL